MSQTEKIAIVIRGDLLDWQKMNVVAFLASSVAIGVPQTHGDAFVSASQSEYLPFIKMPILVYRAESDGDIKRAFQRAKERSLKIGIYTKQLFATKTETENLEILSKLKDDELDLVGIVVYGDTKVVSKALDGLKFHP